MSNTDLLHEWSVGSHLKAVHGIFIFYSPFGTLGSQKNGKIIYEEIVHYVVIA